MTNAAKWKVGDKMAIATPNGTFYVTITRFEKSAAVNGRAINFVMIDEAAKEPEKVWKKLRKKIRELQKGDNAKQ